MTRGGAVIDVLVVDDSTAVRAQLVALLESDPHVRVIGAVDSGQAAMDFVAARTPHAILMDLHLPRMDGIETTRRIMRTRPTPIVICSATDPREVAVAFRAMEAGAVACVRKPLAPGHVDFAAVSAELLQTVKLMSEVKVVRRWPPSRVPSSAPSPLPACSIRCVAIGASTGGPQVLQSILTRLPNHFPVPILVVQHITAGFLPGLAAWLSETSGLDVRIAEHGIRPLAGHVYLAPDDFHLGLDASGVLRLSREAPEHGVRPSVAYLFRSLATAIGPAAVGVLLTGMGKDGARELRMLRDCGAPTIAQDRDSSVVYGMPGEACNLDAASRVLPADRIADALIQILCPPITHGSSP